MRGITGCTQCTALEADNSNGLRHELFGRVTERRERLTERRRRGTKYLVVEWWRGAVDNMQHCTLRRARLLLGWVTVCGQIN